MLSDQELIRLIEDGENDRVEFKEIANDLDKFRKTICAFANNLTCHKEPGLLFIGLNDKGKCANLSVDDKLLQKLSSLSRDGKMHPFPSMEVAKRKLQCCELAIIQVEESDNPPVRMAGHCWIRIGSCLSQATPEQERRLTERRRWGNLSYDMQGVTGANVEADLCMYRFREEYLPAALAPEVLAENRRDEREQMKALRLITPDGTPTVAAILMLGKNPSYWFPGAYIQFVRYAGEKVTDPVVDQAELSGPLPDQLRETERLLKRCISTVLDTRGETHVARPDYPLVALREIVRNAVIHRNYEDSHTPVRITWFNNHVEISSPGSVYESVTKENFGRPGVTSYRNPSITEPMKNQGFMQRFGRGIAVAYEELEKNGNPPFEFDIQDTFVFITIRKRQ